MADFSSYTHKWRASTNTNNHTDANKITKRNRQPVSCQPCRSRKLKCDRGHPCDACSKRGESDTCVYGKAPPAAPQSSTTSSAHRRDDSRSSGMKAQDRLKHLEDLVRNMVDASSATANEPQITNNVASDAISDNGLNPMTTEGGSYTGSTHWTAILQHINELKNDMTTSKPESGDEPVDHSTPDALFGSPRPPSLEYILKTHLPPRIQVDRRISQYFGARYMVLPIIHMQQFRRRYEQFWQNPLDTNIMWISLMFSICCLSASLSLAANQNFENHAEALNSRESLEAGAAQCLVLGNYSKPQPWVVEALCLFLQCKYSSSLDPQREVSLIFAVQSRLAYLMGYHRDGSNYPNQFTVFESEMRRRLWAMIKQFDMMVAFQLGIPNNIPPESWDTKPPSNLIDTDFDEDTKVLPPSRPETDITQTLYFVVKSRIVDTYTKICHHAISFPAEPPALSEIMTLDAEIREKANSVPESLRIRPIGQSITDPAVDVMSRLNISYLWRKSLCVLHRKYITVSGNEYSYNTCLESASAMCNTIIDLYPEFQPGGAFEKDGWMLTSFTIIDFLLANVILCLTISISRKKHTTSGGDAIAWLNLDATRSVLSILDKSHPICVAFSTNSREAKRVSGVISAFLERMRDTKRGPIVGGDITRLSTNTSKDRQPAHGSCKESLSLKPLYLSDRPYSVNISGTLGPPDLYTPGSGFSSATPIGDINHNPISSASPSQSSTVRNTGITPPSTETSPFNTSTTAPTTQSTPASSISKNTSATPTTYRNDDTDNQNASTITQNQQHETFYPITTLTAPGTVPFALPQPCKNPTAPFNMDMSMPLDPTTDLSMPMSMDLDFHLDIDPDFGPFKNFIDNNTGIDWTQLDQFTGFYGGDPGLGLVVGGMNNSERALRRDGFDEAARQQTEYTDDWHSEPVYNLGLRVRDPVTGKSHAVP